MKHISIILTLCCIFTLSARELKLFPSLMVNLTDQAIFVPKNRPLQVKTVSKVERGQPFYVNAALILKQPLEKELQLSGTMRISSAPETETSLKWSEPIRLPANSRGVIILPRYITVIFDQKDKPGKRDFTLTLTDGDKKILTASASVELVESITDFNMMDKKEFDQFFVRYYSNPRPERLLAALNYFLTEEVIAARRKNRRYDPRSILHGFAEAFKLNPQFYDELARMSGTEPHKNFDFAFLLADIGPQIYTKHKSAINPHVIAQLEKFNYRSPMAMQEPEIPAHLDILIAEFFITGKFAPVKRLTANLQKRTA